MKKAFTLFAFVVCVMFSYAQLTESQVISTDNENLPRSDWFGFSSNASSAFIFSSEAEYLLRIPAGSISSEYPITQVTFRHLTSESFSNYTGDPFNNETYFIRFYTGTHYETVTYLDTNNVEQTRDSLVPGTLAYEMSYSPTETGIQIVTLSQPFYAPAGDFCVSIYAPDKSAGGLCPADTTCAELSYAMMDPTVGWRHYRFASSGSTNYEHKPWFLAVYYEDGQAYQPKSDWRTEMYDPDDAQTYPDEVTSLYIDQYTDSLRVYVGAFNMGIDSSYGSYYLNLYVDGTNPYTFWNNDPLTNEGEYLSYNPNYGFRFQQTICGIDELEGIGVTFPFDLCFNIVYTSAPGYNGVDPNLSNNTYCVTYTNEEEPTPGVHEATNTLNVYPNPACNYINVENAAGAQISIYNIAGQEVVAIEVANANESINVANLTEGVYVVRVVNGNEVATSKVSIVR